VDLLMRRCVDEKDTNLASVKEVRLLYEYFGTSGRSILST
ncbi:MAG: hypothetical protein ACI81T_004529, partial [Bacteroidia bacterium]